MADALPEADAPIDWSAPTACPDCIARDLDTGVTCFDPKAPVTCSPPGTPPSSLENLRLARWAVASELAQGCGGCVDSPSGALNAAIVFRDALDNMLCAALAPRTLDQVEREHVELTLRLTKGNKSKAARILNTDRRTLYRKLEAYARADTKKASGAGDKV